MYMNKKLSNLISLAATDKPRGHFGKAASRVLDLAVHRRHSQAAVESTSTCALALSPLRISRRPSTKRALRILSLRHRRCQAVERASLKHSIVCSLTPLSARSGERVQQASPKRIIMRDISRCRSQAVEQPFPEHRIVCSLSLSLSLSHRRISGYSSANLNAQ